MSGVDLYLRYYHDFKKLTGILGCEVHRTTIKYGGGTTMDFSNVGLSFGLLYYGNVPGQEPTYFSRPRADICAAALAGAVAALWIERAVVHDTSIGENP